jgi:hypothetical protein
VETRGSCIALEMYASIVLGEESFWLMTIAMPFWQWLVWPQKIQMGLVSLTSTL